MWNKCSAPVIKHLRRGCLRVERTPDGVAYRWKVRSLAFKGEAGREGVPATWIVGEPAARAIRVLEALQPPRTDLLFAYPSFGHAQTKTAGLAISNPDTNKLINDFVAWANTYGAEGQRSDRIPSVGGWTWRLQTRQLRRTLAWFIARRPGGVIAGALQYRHISIQMFEGYAGTSESGFRDEVESEQALARGAHLMAMIDVHEHTDLGGPGAAEAGRRLEEFGGQVSSFPGKVVTDARRLKRLMHRHDPAVYPGTYVTCVYDHTKALCRKTMSNDGQTAPSLGDCKPTACGNVALTRQNTAAWQREVDRIDARLAARPPLPPLLEHRLRERHHEIIGFLSRASRGADR